LMRWCSAEEGGAGRGERNLSRENSAGLLKKRCYSFHEGVIRERLCQKGRAQIGARGWL
jgi:hypothetical protein